MWRLQQIIVGSTQDGLKVISGAARGKTPGA
jgi:hypothetical protein